MASDNDTAAAGRRLLVVQVLGLDTGLAGDPLESLTILVLANAANVDDGVGLENVLRSDWLAVIAKKILT